MYVPVSSSQDRKLSNISPGVGEADWAFMTTFDCTEGILSGPNVDLVFDGLDTFAAVKLVSCLASHMVGVFRVAKCFFCRMAN
jgi:hypothetical protein